jgi:hypothetical protein
MIVIRRMVDRHRAYTAIFLKGEPPKIFPTSDAEHARILQVYKQDRPHEGILNDFADVDVPATSASASPHGAPSPWPLAAGAKKNSKKKQAPIGPADKNSVPSVKKSPHRTKAANPLWLAVVSKSKSPRRP